MLLSSIGVQLSINFFLQVSANSPFGGTIPPSDTENPRDPPLGVDPLSAVLLCMGS